MSTDDSNPGGNNDSAGGADDKNKQHVSYDSHQKLLGEKKKLQQSYDEMKQRFDSLENERLEKEGKYKEQNEALKKANEELKSKFNNYSKTVSEKVIKAQFAREAEKLGCVDADLAFMVCNIDDLELNGDLEFDGKVLNQKIQGIMKDKPHLFSKNVTGPKDKSPNGKFQETTEDLSKMSSAEILERAKKLV